MCAHAVDILWPHRYLETNTSIRFCVSSRTFAPLHVPIFLPSIRLPLDPVWNLSFYISYRNTCRFSTEVIYFAVQHPFFLRTSLLAFLINLFFHIFPTVHLLFSRSNLVDSKRIVRSSPNRSCSVSHAPAIIYANTDSVRRRNSVAWFIVFIVSTRPMKIFHRITSEGNSWVRGGGVRRCLGV